MTTPIYTTLPDFFHRYDPPQLSPPSPQAGRGSTRQPNPTSHDVFESLNDRSLHVTHDATILPSLSTLLDSSWSEAAKTSPIGYLYDGFLEMTKHYLENTVIENEYNDLSSIFIHHLFALPNLVASRHKSLLIQEAYPAQTMKSSWSKSVSRVDHFADHYATLAPINTGVPRRASDRIPVEKKLPWKVGMQSIMGGLEAAAAGEGVETGFKIRLNEMADGVAQYLIPDNALLDSVFIDALMQVRLLPPTSTS